MAMAIPGGVKFRISSHKPVQAQAGRNPLCACEKPVNRAWSRAWCAARGRMIRAE
jgi:hypothetical protein